MMAPPPWIRKLWIAARHRSAAARTLTASVSCQTRSQVSRSSSMVNGATIAALLTTTSMRPAHAVAKYLRSQGINVLQVVWARFAFQLLFIVAIRPKSELRRMLATSRPSLHVVRALIILGITIMFFLAVRMMPLAEATTLSLMSPLFITALSVPMLGEYVGRRGW